ncbi:nucleosidase [Lottiidibacillus patelloidae]|uniref:Nucleosidase n=1 Tax=Lottiidibacillus patelloidae TaxID=2670334 RepID=A0A263BWK8_9BACI|nr:HAD hydrolase-like protein [Lottiidibacillus patelloidae]OZM57576.1 nucleosidase [Lottiidibacillus patelloidae]
MTTSFIFDMDGTLFQTNKILEVSLEDTFKYLRSIELWEKETPIDKYRKIMGVPLPIVWETLLPNHSNEIRVKANEIFHEKLIVNIKSGNGALYPNVKTIFKYIKSQNCSIFIASNGQTEYLNAIVNHYNLDKWVKETYSIQHVNSLNKADLVNEIIKKYEIKNGAVIGDRLSDINAAKENNLLAVGCRFDFAQEEELKQANLVIDNLLDLKELIIKTS